MVARRRGGGWAAHAGRRGLVEFRVVVRAESKVGRHNSPAGAVCSAPEITLPSQRAVSEDELAITSDYGRIQKYFKKQKKRQLNGVNHTPRG